MKPPRDEHFSPDGPIDLERYLLTDDYLGVHHLIRYLWARTALSDAGPFSTLLDLGCGDGYGTFQLATAFPKATVLGCDYDESAVVRARNRYCLPNLSFRAGDGTRWPDTIGGDIFDVIVCFDVLEHVVHREIFMEELVQHLDPSGSLLFSTPCAADWNEFRPSWEFHQIEYSSRSLFDFMSRYFRLLGRPDNDSLPHLEVFDALRRSNVTYSLKMNPLLCSQPVVIPNPYPRGRRP